MQHLLVFEPDPKGHAAEWIEHLVRKIHADGYPQKVSVAVPVDLADELVGAGGHPWQDSVRVLPLRSWETALCNCRLLAVNGFARWWVMRRKLRQAAADHGLFLGIDLLSLPLGLGLGFHDRPVSGILFRPSIHYPRDERSPPSLRERVRDLRKSLLYRLMLNNRAVRSVRSLDPYFPAYAATHLPNPEKVRAVPDPVHPIAFAPGNDTLELESIPAERTVFVIFGVLSERKGILTLIEALRRLEPRYTSAIAVYAAGQTDPRIAKRLDSALEELGDIRPELWLRLVDRRLTSGEIAALVQRADVVLAPYQRFVGSSGVLLWAAKAGKPVITQDYGLLGRLAREFSLGATVDTCDPSALAAAIAWTVRNGAQKLSDPDGMMRFLDARTPDAFATSLLEGVSGNSVLRPHVTPFGAGGATATD